MTGRHRFSKILKNPVDPVKNAICQHGMVLGAAAHFPGPQSVTNMIDAEQRTEVISRRWPLARDCEQKCRQFCMEDETTFAPSKRMFSGWHRKVQFGSIGCSFKTIGTIKWFRHKPESILSWKRALLVVPAMLLLSWAESFVVNR